MKNGDRVYSPLDTYTIIEQLGHGRYGLAYKVESKRYKEMFCLKVVEMEEGNEGMEKLCKSEAEVLRCVGHKNVIKLYEYFENNNKFYYVTEYCPNGTLKSKIPVAEPYTNKTRNIFRSLFEALDNFHNLNIAHRDIKPQNIAFDAKGNPKILDWGFAISYSEGQLLNTYCGTYPYLPPECFKRIPYDGSKADCWSLGVTLYEYVFGKDPWGNEPQDVQMTNLVSSNKKYPDDAPHVLVDLLNKLLEVDPNQRFSAAEALQHPYLAGCQLMSHSLTNIKHPCKIFLPVKLTHGEKWRGENTSKHIMINVSKKSVISHQHDT